MDPADPEVDTIPMRSAVLSVKTIIKDHELMVFNMTSALLQRDKHESRYHNAISQIHGGSTQQTLERHITMTMVAIIMGTLQQHRSRL